jgi:leucyl-tRNA synthetase
MPVDLYIGGAEHAVLHLLYSRFWHKVLFDLGIVSTDEPFKKLFNQGMILAFAYETANGAKVATDLVETKTTTDQFGVTTTFTTHIETGEVLTQIVAKMSKSLKNVVNPDDVVRNYGADSLRLYEMFMGPLDERKPWADKGVKGVFNFLNRVYRFFSDLRNITEGQEDPETEKALHQAIRKVTSDIENLKFNTAVSALMVFNNTALKKEKVTRNTAELFVRILSPFAPHLAEELWSLYGHTQSLAYEAWPEANQKLLQENVFAYPVSFNGKMRFQFELPLNLTVNEIEKAVLGYEKTTRYTEGKTVRKIIVIPGKIINVVVS